MLKTTKRYVITTNAVNAYKFRLLSLGLDWSLYDNNPIMLYMHRRATGQNKDEVQPLGNVREIEYDEATGEYTGRLYFNPKDPFAVSVYEMYENGTMNMLSIGFEPVEMSEDPELMEPGQLYATITKAIVKEISCVDIGANAEACGVALYDASGKLITLSDTTTLKTFFKPLTTVESMKITTLAAPAILIALKLDENTTEAAVFSKITDLVTLADTQGKTIQTLTQEKTKVETDLAELVKLSNAEKITALVDGAVNDRKITEGQKAKWMKLAEGDFENAKSLLDDMAGSPALDKALHTGNESGDPEMKTLAAKSYDELFLSGEIMKLQAGAPEEFKRIYKAKFGKDPK